MYSFYIKVQRRSNQMSEKDFCFIVTPIGSDESSERRFADGISREVIEPVVESFNMKPIMAHEISETGSINDQVIEHIYEDKLVIANLTGLNPNVMYELGIRYTMQKHTILICEEGTSLPFDIIAERTIFYIDDIAGGRELKKRLTDMIGKIDFESIPRNPVSVAVKLKGIFDDVKVDGTDVEKLAVAVEELSHKIDNLFSTDYVRQPIGYKTENGTFADHSAIIKFNQKVPNILGYCAHFENFLGSDVRITGFNDISSDGCTELLINYFCYGNSLIISQKIESMCNQLFSDFEIKSFTFEVVQQKDVK